MNEPMLERIVIDADVMSGKPIIRGTRVPVELLVRMVAQGVTDEEILQEYPRLRAEDIRAALFYAAMVLAHEDVFPLDKVSGSPIRLYSLGKTRRSF